ncbi:MAG: arginine--tRNA ligase [Actinobacteria bacterium]|nr:arginine--tRNA ligase [Actinomycetota bacterium]
MADLGAELQLGSIHLERPLRIEHGDWSSNVALASAKHLGKSPREVAQHVCEGIVQRGVEHLESVEVAGPGFVNFHLNIGWLHDVLLEVIAQGEDGYGRLDLGHGERVNLEFVSANPTGPIHVGNGWWGAYGDSLARVMERCGYSVHREYYVNDTGRQVQLLGESLLARKRGEEVPESGYRGAYVERLAEEYEGPQDATVAGKWATEGILAEIERALSSVGIHYDEWYSQASVEESGFLYETIDLLRGQGLVEDRDGATWFLSSGLGDTRDRVLVKDDGTPTYLAGDLAYHRNKLEVRGFDRAVDIFGADHQGQVPSLKAGITALGMDPDRLEILIGQMVSLVEGGQAGKMSKRSGNFVPLDDLVADIGPDATRLLALMGSLDQASTLDLDIVRSQSMENPVYYIQYAYARIQSLGRVQAERSIERIPIEKTDLNLLAHPREMEILRALEVMPDIVAEACEERAPHKLTTWVRRLAAAFHGFYHDCPVLPLAASSEDAILLNARLWLVEGCRIGMATALSLLGVSAPDRM